MINKRLIILMVAVLLCLLASCASKTGPQTDPEIPPTEEVPATAETEQPTETPVDYTVFCGKYSDTETVEGPCYTVSILNVDNETKAIELSVSFVGVNSSPVYVTEPIYAFIADDHTVQFDWEDSWKNQGVGTLVLDPEDPSAVQLLMTVTEEAEFNRGTLSTKDQYKTLMRR